MSTQDALSMMTAQIMAAKNAKATKLTPVGAERPTTLPTTPADFPNDHPDEAYLDRLSILEELYAKMADHDEAIEALHHQVRLQFVAIREAMDAARIQLGLPSVGPAPAVTPLAAREAEGDAKARSRAEAATAPAADADADLEQALSASLDAVIAARFNSEFEAKSAAAQDATFEWQCPDHHQVEMATSRLGRAYPKCPVNGCKQFRRLGL